MTLFRRPIQVEISTMRSKKGRIKVESRRHGQDLISTSRFDLISTSTRRRELVRSRRRKWVNILTSFRPILDVESRPDFDVESTSVCTLGMIRKIHKSFFHESFSKVCIEAKFLEKLIGYKCFFLRRI